MAAPTIWGAWSPTYFSPLAAPQSITAPLLDAGAAVYAPTPTTGAVTVTAPLLTSSAALHAPTFIPGAVGLTIPLLNAGPAVFAPTTMAAQFVTIPLLASATAVYAPTLTTGAIWVTVPVLNAGPALFSPTAFLDQFVTLGLIDAGPVIFAPSLAVGPVTLTLPQIDSARALYAPTPFLDNFVELPVLDSGAALLAPTVTLVGGPPQGLTLPLLGIGGGPWSPSAIPGLAAWLDATQDSFADGAAITAYPEHSTGVVFTPGVAGTEPHFRANVAGKPRIHFDGNDWLGIPAWTVPPAGVTFVIVLRSTGFASYDMFITSQGGGSGRGIELRSEAGAARDQIVVDYTGFGIVFSNSWTYSVATDSVHVLRVNPGVATESWIDGHRTVGGTLPAVHGISGNLWFGRRDDGYYANMHVGEAMVFAGAISDADLALLTQYLDAKWRDIGTPPVGVVEQLFAPGFTQFSPPKTLTLPLLDAGPAVFAPITAPAAITLTVPQIASTAALFSPTLTVGAVAVGLPQIASTALVFSPTLAVGPVAVALPVLDSGPGLFAPVAFLDQFLTIPQIISSALVFTPTITTGGVLLDLPLLDSGGTTFEPTFTMGGPTQALTLPLITIGAGAFGPTDIAGLGLWLEADAITGVPDGTAFATWPDQSPAGRHAAALSAGALYRAAGPSVDFIPGLDRRMRIPGLGAAVSGSVGSTTFLVTTIRSTGNYNVLLTTPTNGLWQWLIECTVNGGWYYGNGNGAYRMFDTSRPLNVRRVTTFRDRDDAGLADVFDNGIEDTSYLTPSSDFRPVTATFSDPDAVIGGYYDSSLAFDGQVHAVLFYDRALTNAERVQVEAYLAFKWMGGAPPAGGSVEQLFAPGLAQFSPAKTLTAPLLDAVSALYAPTPTVGAVAVAVPLIDAGPTLYAPTAFLDQFVTTPLLASPAAVYAPTLTAGAVALTVPQIDAGPALFAPTLLYTKSGLASPSRVVVVAAARAPVTTAGAAVTPARVTAAWSARAPIVGGNVTAVPTRLTATWASRAATAASSRSVAMTRITAAWTLRPTTGTGSLTIPVTRVSTGFVARTPGTTGTGLAGPSRVVVSWSARSPAGSATGSVTPTRVAASWTSRAPVTGASSPGNAAAARVSVAWASRASVAKGTGLASPIWSSLAWAIRPAIPAAQRNVSASAGRAVATWTTRSPAAGVSKSATVARVGLTVIPRSSTSTGTAVALGARSTVVWSSRATTPTSSGNAALGRLEAVWGARGAVASTAFVARVSPVTAGFIARSPSATGGGVAHVTPILLGMVWIARQPLAVGRVLMLRGGGVTSDRPLLGHTASSSPLGPVAASAGPLNGADTSDRPLLGNTVARGERDRGSFEAGPTTGRNFILSVPIITSGAVIFAPSAFPVSLVTLGLVDAEAALFAPTLTVTAVTLDPTSIPGCVIALDASTLPVGSITVWPDLSPSANHLHSWQYEPYSSGEYVTITTTSPVGTLNVLPMSGTDPSHLFLVIRTRPGLTGSFMGWGQPMNAALWDLFQVDDDTVLWHGYGGGYSQCRQPYTPEVWHVVDLSYDGGTTLSLGVDGNLVVADNVTGINTGSGYLRVGMGQYVPMSNFDLSELLIYDRALTDLERTQVKDYLNDKWFSPAGRPTAATYMMATTTELHSGDAVQSRDYAARRGTFASRKTVKVETNNG